MKNRRTSRPPVSGPARSEAGADAPAPNTVQAPASLPTPASGRGRLHAVMPWLRAIVGVVLVLGLSTALALGARKYVRSSPRFAVTVIEIQGHKRLTPERIALVGGITKGINIFAVDTDVVRNKLRDEPWAQEVKVSRKLPDTIYVWVKEKEAAALAACGETFLITREGEVIKRFEPGDPYDLPVLTGLPPQLLATDKDTATHLFRRGLDLAQEYERTPLAGRMPLQEVHLSDDGSVDLVLGKSSVHVALGAPPFRRKLDRRGAKADAVMLDNQARPERAVVRLR
jgi:cell division protein FtsQ